MKNTLLTRKEKLAVVGMGYVGFPLAVAFAERGVDVIGFDINSTKIEEYLKGSKFRGSCIRRDGLLIDDVDDVLQQLFAGIPIREVTITDYDNIRYLEERSKRC